MTRDRRRVLTAAVVLLLPALAIVLPALGGDSAVAAALLVPLLAAGLSAGAAALALGAVLRARQNPAPVRVRALSRRVPSPSDVDVHGRPERPRAPGCGR